MCKYMLISVRFCLWLIFKLLDKCALFATVPGYCSSEWFC